MLEVNVSKHAVYTGVVMRLMNLIHTFEESGATYLRVVGAEMSKVWHLQFEVSEELKTYIVIDAPNEKHARLLVLLHCKLRIPKASWVEELTGENAKRARALTETRVSVR